MIPYKNQTPGRPAISQTVAKQPKAPLLGQAPSARPPPPAQPVDTRTGPAAAMARQVMAQKMGAQPRYENAPATPQPRANVVPRVSQPMAPQPMPRAPVAQPTMSAQQQAAAAMKAKAGGDYPNPEWQPKPAYLTTGQAYTPAPVGNVVPATAAPQRYQAPPIANAPVQIGIGAYNTTPVRGAPDTSGSFVPKNPVEMNPRYVPGMPNEGEPNPTIGIDGQTIEPRPIVPASTTPMRTGPPTGPNPTDAFDWEALADELGIEGLQDQVKETTAKETLGAMTADLSQYGYTPDELAAQEAQIIRQAAEAKAKAMQQMAGRGLGGSGLEIAGLGNIDVGAIGAITDLQTENKALQIEERLNYLKTYLAANNANMDDETRNNLAEEAMNLEKLKMENDKASQEESDRHTALNNMLAQIGAEQWDPDALAWAYDQLDAGASYADVLRDLSESSSAEAFVPASVLAQATAKDNEEQNQGAPSLTPSGEYAPAEPVWYEDPSQIPALYAAYVDEANAAGATPMSQGEWLQWNLLNMTPEVKSQYGVST